MQARPSGGCRFGGERQRGRGGEDACVQRSVHDPAGAVDARDDPSERGIVAEAHAGAGALVMDERGLSADTDLPAVTTGAPAQLDVLAVQEQVLAQRSDVT